MKRVMNRKGLSEVVTNLIIILLVIVAIGIVWFVVSNLLGETTEGISLSKVTIGMEIQNVVYDNVQANVTVQRSSGEGNLTAVKILIYNSAGDSQAYEEISTMGTLETQKFVLDYADTPVKVEVAPIITTSKGKQKTGDVVDVYEFE